VRGGGKGITKAGVSNQNSGKVGKGKGIQIRREGGRQAEDEKQSGGKEQGGGEEVKEGGGDLRYKVGF